MLCWEVQIENFEARFGYYSMPRGTNCLVVSGKDFIGSEKKGEKYVELYTCVIII